MPKVYPQVSTGITVTFADSGFSANIINVTPPNRSREALETSHMGTTGGRTFTPGKLYDGGEFNARIQFDSSTPAPIGADPELITITFPDNSTWAFNGFLTSEEPAADLETVMEADVTFKVTGDVTPTVAPA